MVQIPRMPAGELSCAHSTRLADSLAAVRQARELVAALWREWGFPADDLIPRLLTTEVVSNALNHSYPPRYLYVARRGAHQVLVQVSDTSVVPPHLELAPEGTTGRGLLLVDRLADCWGHRTTPTGKHVWFVLSGRAEDVP